MLGNDRDKGFLRVLRKSENVWLSNQISAT